MNDKVKLRHALLDSIEKQQERLNRELDTLSKAMDAIQPAERVGPDWGPDGAFAK